MRRLATPQVIAVCASRGGIPKIPLCRANVTTSGIEGDAHAHDKHNRPDRAISLFDLELLNDLVAEGFPLRPGSAGENLTVAGLHVQSLPRGTRLRIGAVVLQLEEPRKPCYVLDLIVLGTHGHTGLSHLLLGSIAEKVVRLATCPVLTVHPKDHPFRMNETPKA